jgi:hypothetical protein
MRGWEVEKRRWWGGAANCVKKERGGQSSKKTSLKTWACLKSEEEADEVDWRGSWSRHPSQISHYRRMMTMQIEWIVDLNIDSVGLNVQTHWMDDL